MRRESQRELIEEGFIDFVKGVASRTADIGRAVGKGIDKVVSSDIGRGVAAAFMKTPVGRGLKNDLEPILSPVQAFNKQQPLGALKTALKDQYYRTFDFKSIKYGKEQKLPGDQDYDNRVAIPFEAKLVRPISSSRGSSGPTGSVVGGLDQGEFVAVLGRNRKSAFGLTGETGIYELIIVQASDGKTISPDKAASSSSRSKITSKEWRGITDTVKNYRIPDSKYKDVVKLIAAELGRRPDSLTSNTKLVDAIKNDLKAVKYDLPDTEKELKIQSLLESTKISQLQLLESSYNLRYELPINKGN